MKIFISGISYIYYRYSKTWVNNEKFENLLFYFFKIDQFIKLTNLIHDGYLSI